MADNSLQNLANGSTIVFTAAAADRVKGLITEENDPSLCLRISIKGGGCSGFQYEFGFDQARPDDWVIEKNAVKLVVDPLSYQFLKKAEVDFRNDIEGERFVIRNPNAKTTCGCGSSFAAKEIPEAEKEKE